MLQKIRVLLLVCITAVLAACGGGGDSSSDATPNFAGKYIESFNLTGNSCNLSLQTSLTGTDNITQSGRNINIVSSGSTFNGVVDADNGGFTATGSTTSNGVTVQATIKFRTITAGSTYSIDYRLTTNGCNIIYTGTATKA